jgi:hypothetical protein
MRTRYCCGSARIGPVTHIEQMNRLWRSVKFTVTV